MEDSIWPRAQKEDICRRLGHILDIPNSSLYLGQWKKCWQVELDFRQMVSDQHALEIEVDLV